MHLKTITKSSLEAVSGGSVKGAFATGGRWGKRGGITGVIGGAAVGAFLLSPPWVKGGIVIGGVGLGFFSGVAGFVKGAFD